MSMKMQNMKDHAATFGREREDIYSSIKAGSYASLPKNIKAKFNLPLRPSTTVQNSGIHNRTNKSGSKSLEKSNTYTYIPQDVNLMPRDNMRSSSRTKLRKTGMKNQHPSQVYKCYSKCHKYHTDLDNNYLFDQKYHHDSLHTAKDKITTKAIKDCSPDNYYRIHSPDLTRSRMDYINLNKSIQESKRFHDDYASDNDKKFKSSRGIISNVIDSQFSVNSPSQLKLYKDEMGQLKNEEFRDRLSQSGGSPDRIYMDDNNTRLTINLSYVGENPSERYLEALESVMTTLDPIFDRLDLNDKINKFLEIADDHRRTVRLGSLVAIYSICSKYDIDDDYKLHIIEKVSSLIQNFEIQEELFLVACLEILSIYAPNELLLQNLNLICMFLTDFNYPKLQKAAFHCIMCMEYEGIKVI
jgi:hypothetical protein